MYLFLLIYLIPGMINSLLYREQFREIEDSVPDATYAYAIICFMPVINILALIYGIISYVCEIFRKN